jgi:stage II sporulation protein GA (sporulation sigma-E factor processing peptidase)
MVYIAFNSSTPKELCKQLMIFYMTSFVFGGAALYLIHFIKPQEAQTQNGVYIGEYPLKVVLLGGIVGFTIIVIAFKIIKSKLSSNDIFYDLEIYVEGEKIETKAMIDTGNMLKEPITNTPVIIVEHTLLYEAVSKQILNNIDEILLGNFNNIEDEIKEKYVTKLRFIPFSSIGKVNGMLLGIKADKLVIKNDEMTKKVEKVVLAIYNKSLTKRGEYRALLGINII